jgi:hypothetical protein
MLAKLIKEFSIQQKGCFYVLNFEGENKHNRCYLLSTYWEYIGDCTNKGEAYFVLCSYEPYASMIVSQ